MVNVEFKAPDALVKDHLDSPANVVGVVARELVNLIPRMGWNRIPLRVVHLDRC